MADDLIDSVLDDGLDDDIPVMLGGQRRLMKSGHLVVDGKNGTVAGPVQSEPAKASWEKPSSITSAPVVPITPVVPPPPPSSAFSTTAFEVQKVSKPFMPAGKPMISPSDRTEPVRVSKPTVVSIPPKQTLSAEPSQPPSATAVRPISPPPPPAPPLTSSKPPAPPTPPPITPSSASPKPVRPSVLQPPKPVRTIAKPLPSARPKPKSEPKPPPIKEKDPLVQYQEDLKEVKAIAERGLPDGSVEADTVDRIIVSLPSDIERASGYGFVDEAMRQRFVLAAEAFFKDLRDDLETESKFSMPTGSGGLGMTDAQAKNSVRLLVERRNDFLVAQRSKAEREKRQFVAGQVDRQLKTQERQAATERSELDRRFVKLTGQETTPKPQVESQPKPEPTVVPSSTQSIDTRPAGTPKVIRVVSGPASDRKTAGSSEASRRGDAAVAETFRDLFGDSQKAPEAVKVPPPVNLPLAEGETPIGTSPAVAVEAMSGPTVVESGTTQSAVQSSKPKVVVSPGTSLPSLRYVAESASGSPRSSAPPLPGLQPKPTVSDVMSSPRRLTGPVEELGSLTLQDFRRLSKSPQEAILKIRDKLDLLKDESFESKVAGIRAWRNSVVNRLYLDALRQSLVGRPVNEVLSEMAKGNGEALTKPEFDVLMELNRKLRF